MTDPIRQPRTTEQAQALLEEYASLDGQVAEIEENRRACIADVNKRCDTAVHDLVVRRNEIVDKLEPWWAKASEGLTSGKRKSIELGGCVIGSRAGSASLAYDGPGTETLVALKLLKRKWAKGLYRVTVSLNKPAILAALSGPHKA